MSVGRLGAAPDGGLLNRETQGMMSTGNIGADTDGNLAEVSKVLYPNASQRDNLGKNPSRDSLARESAEAQVQNPGVSPRRTSTIKKKKKKKKAPAPLPGGETDPLDDLL